MQIPSTTPHLDLQTKCLSSWRVPYRFLGWDSYILLLTATLILLLKESCWIIRYPSLMNYRFLSLSLNLRSYIYFLWVFSAIFTIWHDFSIYTPYDCKFALFMPHSSHRCGFQGQNSRYKIQLRIRLPVLWWVGSSITL